MTLDRITAQVRCNEGSMKSITFGTHGICPACYVLANITRHHVKPRSVVPVSRDWKPFIVMLCRKCHTILHQLETNANLYLKHNNLADVIQAIRAARALNDSPAEHSFA